MFHYPDLGSDSDCSNRDGNLLQPIRSTTRSVISMGFLQSFLRRYFAGNQSGGVPKRRLFAQARAVHIIYLLSLKIFHLHFFAWLRNYLSFYLFFFFAIDRKQLKLALCRIDSAMQQSGSLNQPPPRFDTLIRSSSMSGKTKKTTCQLLNFEKQSKSMHS